MRNPYLVLLVLVASASATFASVECDCTKFPFSPDPPCWDKCAAYLLVHLKPDELQTLFDLDATLSRKVSILSKEQGLTSFKQLEGVLTVAEWNQLNERLNPSRSTSLIEAAAVAAERTQRVREEPVFPSADERRKLMRIQDSLETLREIPGDNGGVRVGEDERIGMAEEERMQEDLDPPKAVEIQQAHKACQTLVGEVTAMGFESGDFRGIQFDSLMSIVSACRTAGKRQPRFHPESLRQALTGIEELLSDPEH